MCVGGGGGGVNENTNLEKKKDFFSKLGKVT